MMRLGKIALTVAVLIVLSILAIPKLLSTSYVKQRITDQMSQLIGRPIVINGDSSISIRPYLGVAYKDVTISDPRDADGRPLISMERFRAKLDLLSALWGDARFTELEFIRPHFNLFTAQNGQKNWTLDKGQISTRLTATGDMEHLTLGTVEIKDGILELNDEQTRRTHQATAINGTFSWPHINASAQASFSTVWRGEVMKVLFSATEPVKFLRGMTTQISLKLDSMPLALTYDGTSDHLLGQAEGTLDVSSPSPKRLANWVGWKASAADRLEQISISGQVSIKQQSIEFPEAIVKLGEHEGRGRLQLAADHNSNDIKIAGTLAFDTLGLPDLRTFLSSTPGQENSDDELDYSFLNGVALDVRLSANAATSPPLEMTNLAASIIMRNGSASFDIGQAEALGGTIAGSLSMKSEDTGASIAANISMSKIELETLTQTYRNTGISLSGVGDVDLKLKSAGADKKALIHHLNGEGSLRGNDGTLSGLDLHEILAAEKANAYSVSRISSATTSYDQLRIGFFIANGTAVLRDSALANPAIEVSLNGRTDLVRQSLALSGRIQLIPKNEEQANPLPFFIGGTASSPLFVPLPERTWPTNLVTDE